MIKLRTSTSRYANLAIACSRYVASVTEQLLGYPALALPDTIAMAVAIDGSICHTRPLYVAVETKSELTRGETVVDEWGVMGQPPNVHVCFEPNAQQYKRLLWELLKADLLSSHHPEEVIKEEWQRFIFPQFGDIDVLEILLTLTTLGYRDPRMQAAVDLVVSKQDTNGRWSLERSYHGRMRTALERQGQPSKWITLRAMTILKRFYSLGFDRCPASDDVELML